MPRALLDALNFGKNEAQNMVLQNLGADIGSPIDGLLFYRSDTNRARIRANGVWQDIAFLADVTASAIAQTLIDAKGDLIVGTADNTVARKAVGANGTFLVAASGQTDGLQWRVIQASDIQELLATNDLSDWPRVASLDLNTQKLTSVASGTAATDGVNLGQVQGLIDVGTNKTSVRGASTANLAVATALVNGLVHDGVTYATGERILLKNQTASAENGIYNIVASGAAARSTDADISAEVKGGLSVWVNEGTTNGDSRWVLTTNDPIVLGTTALTFVQDFAATSTTAGAGLAATGNVLSVNVDSSTIEISADTLRLAATAAGNGLTGGGGSVLAVGAGTGIAVAADTVAVDTTVVPRKYAQAITGGATSEVVTHNLGTRDVVVALRNPNSPWDEVIVTNEATTVNTITLRSGAAVLPAGYRVLVLA